MPATNKSCKLEKQQNNFIDYLKYEKRRSAHTVVAYQTDLNQFIDFVKAEYSILECSALTHKIIRAWVVQLVEADCQPRSVRRKMSALNAWFNYLVGQALLPSNPAKRVITPKVAKRITVAVPEKDLAELFHHDFFDTDFEGVRNKTFFEFFYATGMRLSELVQLKLSDIDEHAALIKISGKRNKQRLIPYGSKLQTAIQQYLQHRKQVATAHSADFFFLTAGGDKIYPKLVYRIINTYLSKVSSVEKRSPHVLRHSFATHLLNRGADLNAIKELLGHSSLAATQVYTQTNIEKLKSIHSQAHPRA